VAPRVNIVLLTGNIAGAVVYLLLASKTWVVPQQRGSYDPLLWAAAVLPLLACFGLFDLGWGVAIVRGKWRGAGLWAAAVAVWVVAAIVDFAHH
jgi:hypothetical protein